MREIKFKVYYKPHKTIYPVVKINLDKEIVSFKDNTTDTIVVVGYDSVELMKYTGLKDKDGKDIYEGDLVAIDYPQFNHTQVDEVEWNKVGWDPFYGSMQEDGAKYKIVGNKYTHRGGYEW